MIVGPMAGPSGARVALRLLSNTVSWDEGLAEFQQFSFAAREVL